MVISKVLSSILISKLLAMMLTITLAGATVAAEHDFLSLKGQPGLRSASALVTDANGNIIYGKDINAVRPIASVTKLMMAMVILDSGVDLDEKITITKDDRDLIRLTGSRLKYGAKLSRRELIQIALMSSENRAASALGRTYAGGMQTFVAQMNRKARKLGMTNSHFADPAGLRKENVSTAKDLSKMIVAAGSYPLIADATTMLRHEVRPYAKLGPLNYGNTNRLLKNKSWDITLSKTGYINEAGRCLVMQTRIGGKAVSIVLLNSFGKLTPYGDSNRLRKWMLTI
jgi:serine-type D-Ala-D-Ala endopeptidase (penicillin-binding protein 7)